MLDFHRSMAHLVTPFPFPHLYSLPNMPTVSRLLERTSTIIQKNQLSISRNTKFIWLRLARHIFLGTRQEPTSIAQSAIYAATTAHITCQ